jgi:hypothetical protein
MTQTNWRNNIIFCDTSAQIIPFIYSLYVRHIAGMQPANAETSSEVSKVSSEVSSDVSHNVVPNINTTSSIYADLQRFRGQIVATKVVNDDPVEPLKKGRKKLNNLDNSTEATKTLLAEFSQPTVVEKTIDDIAAQLKPPLIALRNGGGEIIHDLATIGAKCDKGHIHKYYLKDAESAVCTTCKSGTKFMNLFRTMLESVMGMPFIVADKSPAGYLSYTNPILKITANLGRTSGNNEVTKTGDEIVFSAHPTVSTKKINEIIYASLRDFPLPEAISAKILALAPKSKQFTPAPLPFTPELAALNPKAQLEIVDDPCMRLENC